MEVHSGLPIQKVKPVAADWPPCLLIIAAVVLLVKAADKPTLEQNLTIATPHTLERILMQPPHWWLSNS